MHKFEEIEEIEDGKGQQQLTGITKFGPWVD